MINENETRIRFDRLEQIAEHLEHGKLAHEQFYFSCYNRTDSPDQYKPNGCGTMGCAVGEFPAIWPDTWSWFFDEVRKDGLNGRMIYDVGDWLGITFHEYYHLFIPREQNTKKYGGIELRHSATKYQVAANIRAFIAKMRP